METPDFIELYSNAFSKEYCEEVIDFFEGYEQRGMTHRRDTCDVSDTSLDIATVVELTRVNKELCLTFNEVFWGNCYSSYTEKFKTMAQIGYHSIPNLVVQKTKPGGGYHTWHCEMGCLQHSRRVAAFTLYLNDNYESGETEFLYQQKCLKGKQGDLCIFPAGYTHFHRGNPPLIGAKYILTGWIEY